MVTILICRTQRIGILWTVMRSWRLYYWGGPKCSFLNSQWLLSFIFQKLRSRHNIKLVVLYIEKLCGNWIDICLSGNLGYSLLSVRCFAEIPLYCKWHIEFCDYFEAFTCMPLKKMVSTCVSLKRSLVPVCHLPKLIWLYVIPSQLHPFSTVKSHDMWARSVKSKIPLSLSSPVLQGQPLLNRCGSPSAARVRDSPVMGGCRGWAPPADPAARVGAARHRAPPRRHGGPARGRGACVPAVAHPAQMPHAGSAQASATAPVVPESPPLPRNCRNLAPN
jgi:hypothetical protein